MLCCAVLCCQVALEGAINSKLAQSSLARGELPQGDLIPWTMGQQFQVGCYCYCCLFIPRLTAKENSLFGLGRTVQSKPLLRPCCICTYSLESYHMLASASFLKDCVSQKDCDSQPVHTRSVTGTGTGALTCC